MAKKNKGFMGRSDIPLAQRLTDANALLAEVVKAQALEPDKAIAKIITLLTEAESVDAVEVVHGQWIIKSEIHRMLDDFDEEFYVECPLCGRTFYIPFGFDDGKMLAYAKEKYPYCNCGAKMDGEGSETDGN